MTSTPELRPREPDSSPSIDGALAAPTLTPDGLTVAPRRLAELDAIFAADGVLARHIDGYRSREAQLRMAQAVAAAIDATGRLPDADALALAHTERPSRRLSAQRGELRAKPGAVPAGAASCDADATAGDNTLIVEAGTGTGKTFAYLVPAMLWGGKVIVSTGTKHLQDQLFQRDIPTVRDALAVPISIAMLKGRANYLCHYYLARTADNGRLPSRQDAAHLQEIVRFAKVTRSGDKAELASVPENAPVWSLVTSTRDNCLSQECPHYKDCFVMQARRDAQQADLVVVNHHLFFADIMLRDTGMAELLPSANTIIFDEAHQLPETATLFFGETLSTAQLLELARDSVAEGLLNARDAVEWTRLGATLERAARDVRLAFKQDSLRISQSQLGNEHPLFDALVGVEAALDELIAALAQQAERAEPLANCLRRARELRQMLDGWCGPDNAPAQVAPSAGSRQRGDVASVSRFALASASTSASTPTSASASASVSGSASGSVPPDGAGQFGDERVRWVEVFSHTVQLHQTPLSVAPIFAKQRAGTPRAWVFTSATLSVRGDFNHYATQMGLNARRSMTLSSPFDYPNQALLYVPRNLPQPSSPYFTDAVFDAALPAIEASGGGVFVLCTTLRAVDRMAARLRDAIVARGWPYPLLVQGEASRTELLDRFRQYGNALLVGSQSFWEGVDVRGDALSLVVIDKLPFAPPDDPVLAARLDALTRKGLSPFAMHQLPQAVITLKQGAGRLIRAETDRGVLMICDPRLVDKPYGKRIWQSLPPFRRTREIDAVRTFFTGSVPANPPVDSHPVSQLA
ncbi:ATP-dependent DNA helicase [Mycetohabitans sp. B5]|uniref:ATP-dependent DNA helicase DinG n=1 Tax=Mycetohabitans endofungorum TaxID=417203 RepID=A0A2P5KBK0_9BURK|nr:ATP-dependent DNA helicase [Mycetohabitans sp. B5]PPB84099.1 ATP-dependent DNA helicase DinG [Mycetohabitans endofungorum]